METERFPFYFLKTYPNNTNIPSPDSYRDAQDYTLTSLRAIAKQSNTWLFEIASSLPPRKDELRHLNPSPKLTRLCNSKILSQ